MTYQATILKPAFLGLSLLGLAACQHTDVAAPSPLEATMRNTVQMVRLPFEIKAEDDGTDTPSAQTLASLNMFLATTEAGYGDVLMLDSESASPDRISAIQAFIKARGLTYGGTAKLGSKPAEGSVMLYLERYVVTTPNCGEWAAETSNNERNNPSSFYGCSTAANLGLMVANPRDLVAGQNGGNSTSTAVGAIAGSTPAQSATPPGNMTISLDGMQMSAPMPTMPSSGGSK